MKIWIDITNTPHIHFFYSLIQELKRKHDILITCRPLSNTIDMLNAYNLPHVIIGRHYGASKIGKIVGFFVRCFLLWRYLRTKNVEVSISHSSFYSPFVSRMLGIRCIYLNDNEHAMGNIIAFRFANVVMVPEFLNTEKVIRQGCSRRKLIKYPGVKEGIYLWNYQPAWSDGVPEVENGLKSIFIRPEPRTAQYYKAQKNFLDNLILEIKNEFNIVVLPRDDTQRNHYQRSEFSHVIIPSKPINLTDILNHCDLFIGAGGTMTREVAVLGIPTVSVYQEDLLDVDRLLIMHGSMLHNTNITPEYVRNIIQMQRRRAVDSEILKKGQKACALIKDTLLKSSREGGSDA